MLHPESILVFSVKNSKLVELPHLFDNHYRQYIYKNGKQIVEIWHRKTSIGRKIYSGTNSWDLFYVKSLYPSEYLLTENNENPSWLLGRRDGRDIGFDISPVIIPSQILPDETLLDVETDFSKRVKFEENEVDVIGSSLTSFENVKELYEKLPFIQKLGDTHFQESWEEKKHEILVSDYARENPSCYMEIKEGKYVGKMEDIFSRDSQDLKESFLKVFPSKD